MRPGRRRVTSTVGFGSVSPNQVATPGDVNHIRGEVNIEVSGASSDYPHPTRLQREIEAAVIDVLENYSKKVVDDVDRGDGLVSDGGVTTYECSKCGDVPRCNVDENGQRRCPDCGRAVTAVVTDGGREQVMYKVEVHLSGGDDLGEIVVPQVPVVDDKVRTSDGTIYRVTSRTWLLAATISFDAVASLTVEPVGVDDDVERGNGPVADGGASLYACDTPDCDGEKEVITPDGYVCRDCADALAVQYVEVDRGDGLVTDGGTELVMGRRSRVEECDCGTVVVGYLDGDPCPACEEVIYS